MNELVRDELIRIVRENGEDVLLDPVRTKAFLNDFCGNKYRREINSITLALKEGAATELLNSRRNRTERFAIARLSKNLEESFGFPKQQTIWTVESIAIALGVISQDETVEIENVGSSELERFPETKPEEARSPQFIQDEEKVSGPTIKVKKKRIALPLLGMLSLLLIILFIIISGNSQNKPPNTPSNPGPSHKAANQPLSVDLSWDCSDPDGDVLTYDVYFGTSADFKTPVVTNHSSRAFTKSDLSYNTTYYWKVVAKDSKGKTRGGYVWSFTTRTMILVEKGSFTIGDTWGDGDSDEKPTHKVTFTYDFYMGEYEVTFNEYDAFCEATGGSKPKDEGWGRDRRPVINVSWWDAIAYCNWLSEKEKLPKAYDNNGNLLDKDGRVTTDPSKVVGYRLPTEAEWEYAARGGKKSKGYKYSGSNNVNDVAWYTSNSGSKTQEVGKKKPNELGLYDMSGNVWEWCSDWYGSYSNSAQTNPYNSTAGSGRVGRGGGWGNNAARARVADRGYGSPTGTGYNLGFRIVRTAR